MKFHQEKAIAAPVIPVSKTGACIGDQVLFSPYNENNIRNRVFDNIIWNITPNKLYTIHSITASGYTQFVDDNGVLNQVGARPGVHIGQYDIIIKAPSVPVPEPVFQPVTLTLENIHEVRMFASLLGAVDYCIFPKVVVSQACAVHTSLDEIAVERPYLKITPVGRTRIC